MVPSTIYEDIRTYEPIKADVLRTVTKTHQFLRFHDPDSALWFWYDVREPDGLIYHQVMISYGSQRTFEHFPEIHPELLVLRGSSTPEGLIAILSQDPHTVLQAMELITAQGGTCRLVADQWISSGRIGFSSSILRVHF